MSREQFFKQSASEKPKTEEEATSDRPADWEVTKAKHLAAKEEFHKSREFNHRTGEQKYLDKKFKKDPRVSDKLPIQKTW
jgi:hypothetical protein